MSFSLFSRFSRPAAPLLAIVALIGIVCVVPNTARAQSLNGQTVRVDALYPTQDQVDATVGSGIVTPSGITFNDSGIANISVRPSQVIFTFATANGFSTASFNGFQISETGASPVTITSVTLDPASNLSGFDASRFSFNSGNIFANFQGLAFTTASNVTLNLGFAPAVNPVPEPSEWAVIGMTATTLGGLMVRARRRKGAASGVAV